VAALADLLANAAARIDIGGQPNGSGFFITPTTVVTCHHVLEPYYATSDQARMALEVVDASGRTHAVEGEPKDDAHRDLALLRLASAETSVPVVLLDDGFETRDKLLSFGFPETKPDGEPTTFEVEGQTGGVSELIKFKEGQVRPGTSGSPLLNLRTGAVCGVVRKTRNEKTDLGGYGIRVTQIFGLDENVPRRNREAVTADSRWLDALSVDQRRRVDTRGAGVADDYHEFVIQVSQAEAGWLVAAKVEPGGAVAEVLVDLNAVRAEVPRLFRAWKAQARLDDAEQCRLLGHVLFRSIAPQAIGEELERLAFEEKRHIHVSLCFEPEVDADLVHLPWEQLFVQGRSINAALGARDGSSVTRVCEGTVDRSPRSPVEEAAVLLVSGPESAAREVAPAVGDLQKFVGARKNLAQANVVKTKLSLDEIETFLNENRVDVLHYVGYGRYESRRDQIALADGSYGVEYVDADQLAQVLFNKPPRLVVLETFLADDPLVPVDPTAFGMTLVNAGVEAVVAFPFPVIRQDVAAAIEGLYKQLDDGMPIRLAVQHSRRLLRTAPWSRGALFMRRPSDLRLVSIR
jgi:hypothetical protein